MPVLFTFCIRIFVFGVLIFSAFLFSGCAQNFFTSEKPSENEKTKTSSEDTLTPEQKTMINSYKNEENDPLVALLKATPPAELQNDTQFLLEKDAFMQQWKEKEGVLIDLRTPQEIEIIPLLDEKAENFNYYAPDFGTQFSSIEKNTPLFIYCAHGNRSREVRKSLLKLGFTQVYDLKYGVSKD